LKFVNKFELDAVWGDRNWGDIGADGNDFQVKNSYADFKLGPMSFKVGVQGATLARGFLFSDDFAGAVAAYGSDSVTVPFIWIKPYEGGRGFNKGDVDYYAIAPLFNVNEMFTIQPYFLYATSRNVGVDGAQAAWKPILNTTAPFGNGTVTNLTGAEDLDAYYLGFDLDLKLDNASVWFTGIYQGGDTTIPVVGGNDISLDFSAWLAAIGGKVDLGTFDIHGQIFYATGDDSADNDIEAFFVPAQHQWAGQSYYWSEIMGYGTFDAIVSNGSPADKISNIQAINLGTTVKAMDDLTFTFDLWRAALAEDNPAGENELGIEVDLKASYQLIEGLKLDIIGAYLFAGDATAGWVINNAGQAVVKNNDDNPWEVGTQLSLSF
jgi:hypothetical protein